VGRRREPRRIERRGSKIYDTRDNMLMHVAFFLSQKDQGAMQSMIEYHFKHMAWSTNFYNVKEVLDDMVASNWTRFESYGKFRVYKLTQSGQDAVSKIYELIQANNLLTSLRAFRNLSPESSISQSI
jgi:hypothetical protein